jgi:hypothetical protein
MENHTDISAAFKRMLDLSTSHLAKDDISKFRYAPGVPRITEHEYGLIVFVTSEPDAVRSYLIAMNEAGISQAAIAIYMHASANSDVMLINFDAAGDVIEGLPTFDW